ncbi:MAG: 3-oxoacyl-ACP synthase III, partial [Planctomycetota bacterium]
MRFEHVRLAAVRHVLPDEVVSSESLEERLAPLYERLRLRVGRLELMSGIRERRFWARGTRPSDAAARAGGEALRAAGPAAERVALLVHGAVSRDFLEPATAARVHALLHLPPTCAFFDLSNACLGLLSGLEVAASQIELGALEAALVVSGEDGRGLVEQTLAGLLAHSGDDASLRAALKLAFASLTIGSGAAAVVLAHERLAPGSPRVVGSLTRVASEHHELCQGDRAGAAGAEMATDSEALLEAGVALAAQNYAGFLDTLGWRSADVARVVTHQVGSAHRRALFQRLELDPARDFSTFETLGNTGSAALPTALSLALEQRPLARGEKMALLGIGSGLACTRLGLEGA